MSWPRAMLTDSGGFQVFSLGDLRKVTDEGRNTFVRISMARRTSFRRSIRLPCRSLSAPTSSWPLTSALNTRRILAARGGHLTSPCAGQNAANATSMTIGYEASPG